MLSDFQRWLIRSSAKNMRKEIGGQVRRTLGGGRTEPGDVWDAATTEIPTEVGESPECQWCPVCRAARAMRESSPGLSGHLSTAGDVVASAVQEALKAFDSVLARGGGSAETRSAQRDSWAADPDGWASARDVWAAEHGAPTGEHGARTGEHGAGATEHGQSPDAAAQDVNDEPDGSDEPHDRG